MCEWKIVLIVMKGGQKVEGVTGRREEGVAEEKVGAEGRGRRVGHKEKGEEVRVGGWRCRRALLRFGCCLFFDGCSDPTDPTSRLLTTPHHILLYRLSLHDLLSSLATQQPAGPLFRPDSQVWSLALPSGRLADHASALVHPFSRLPEHLIHGCRWIRYGQR